MEQTQDAPEVLETPATETEVTETPVEETTESAESTQDERDKKIAELEEKNRQLYERAKKAEQKKAPSNDSLAPQDVFTLVKAGVDQDDVDEVMRAAKVLGKSVSDALKDPVVKGILNARAEERKTAEATNVGRSPRGTSKVSGEQILAQAEQTGEVPETSEGLAELFKARIARKLHRK